LPLKILALQNSIFNISSNYANLYKKCWSTDPNRRPILSDILRKLKKLLVEITIEFITNEVNQQPLEYPDKDNNLNEYDEHCIECENALTSGLVLNNILLNESSFSVPKLMSQSPDDL
ncbi:6097_t:CDS:2, partial [Dentiscutata heterogama]